MGDDVIYIISGLPRSGTSMLMQMMKAGGMSVATDEKRIPDKSNPHGYLEVASIINKLKIDPEYIFNFKGKLVKVIAYGLKHLPFWDYKIIYSERNIEEVLDSMEKMMGEEDKNRKSTRESFVKLNRTIKKELVRREDIEVLFVNYTNIALNPKQEAEKIIKFLKKQGLDKIGMINAVDFELYKQKR